MVTRRHLLRSIAAAAALAAGSVPLAAGAADRGPVVVELFTSQGCSSCPAADKFLAELAGRGDVIALSFHVDYWNYMGWTDPFSRADNSARQRAYKHAMGLRYVYTPQMVVDGRSQAIGNEREAVERLIEAAAERPRLPVGLVQKGTTITVTVPGREDAEPAVVWLVVFDRTQVTKVERGENSGRSMVNAHVVHSVMPIGKWLGQPLQLTYTSDALAANRGAAVLVQKKGTGPILGAAMIRPPTS
ncbi:DUF1223 domain-containing protein [Stella sp.]|uniref:DUF1223 domain-containing protein n=1 Tax=Stella sp. TaxID=2912054 RepID=UPI0035B2778A